jgi:uncharacterized protein YifN (PemK superfamily)
MKGIIRKAESTKRVVTSEPKKKTLWDQHFGWVSCDMLQRLSHVWISSNEKKKKKKIP